MENRKVFLMNQNHYFLLFDLIFYLIQIFHYSLVNLFVVVHHDILIQHQKMFLMMQVELNDDVAYQLFLLFPLVEWLVKQ